MINGDLSEAQQGFALLEDVDKASFVRFVRWLYSREYPALEHTTVAISPSSTLDQSAPKFDEPDVHWPYASAEKIKKEKKAKDVERDSFKIAERDSLKDAFINRKHDSINACGIGSFSVPPPRSNKAADEDYTEVFLCHARLYVFAEKYDIQSLKALALKKLQQTLAIYTLYPERSGDIISLLQYVYANTLESVPYTEDIRTMLAHYIGCEMDTLVKCSEIKDVMANNKEMLSDFLDMFASRVV